MAQRMIKDATSTSFETYKALLNDKDSEISGDWSEDFPESGVAREIARIVMPVAGYTELYWKQNLHNLFHMLKLREDSHAQWEIQEFARAIYALVKPLYPAACEAYEDYIRDSKTLSGMETELLQVLIRRSNEFDLSFKEAYDHVTAQFETEDLFLDHFRLSKRELREFREGLGI
jgi:thymidylate synthase ThyX